MISVAILLAVWMVILRYSPFNSDSKSAFSKSLYWALSFVVAVGALYVIYYLQINVLPSLWWNRSLILAELFVSCLILFQSLTRKQCVRWFWFPFGTKGRYLMLLSLSSIGFLAFFALSTSSPLNWDVNAYNLSRISTMLSETSSFLPIETASPRQAVYSLGHDILFYPDIAWGLLRGLPLICVVQFAVLLGVVFSFTDFLLCSVYKLCDSRDKQSSLVLFIAWALLLNSNQQVMQAVVSKNDLFVTLLFTLSIGFGVFALSRLANENVGDISSVLAMIFLVIIALSVKAYGLILLIPLSVLLINIIVSRNFGFTFIKSNILHPRSNLIFWTVVSFVSASILVIEFLQRGHIHSEWSGNFEGVTSLWVNAHGSILSRVSNGFLNAQRILFQGLLFPLTTVKPYFPVGLELQSPISDAWLPEWLAGTQGSAGSAYPFQLLYGTNPDMAYPFLLFTVGIIIGLLGLTTLRSKYGRTSSIFVLLCCCIAFAFFASVLLYQPWISRFLGPTYIPLVPVASVGIYLVINPFYSWIWNYKSFRYAFIALTVSISFLPLISSLSLSGYISKRAGMPQQNSYYYYQYLWTQTPLNKAEALSLIDILQNSPFKQRTLCASGTAWTLTPMVLTQTSQSYEDNARLYSREACSAEIQELTGQPVEMDVSQVISVDGHQFIALP